MSLTTPQRNVIKGMATGLLTAIAAFGLTAWLQPFGALDDNLPARVRMAMLSALAPALMLAVCIARLAAHRFRTPQDLDGSGLTVGTERAKILQALLQNTLEQTVLAVPVYAAFSLFAPARLLAVAPLAALLFVGGRLLFFRGYQRGAGGRALGFALTFYPTLLLLAGAVGLVIAGGRITS